MSAKSEVYNFIKHNDGWHASGNLQRMEFRNNDGTIATPAIVQRRLRELEEEKQIAVKYEKNHAYYKYLPPVIRQHYIPTSEREEAMFDIPMSQIKWMIQHGGGVVEDGVYKVLR